MDHCVTPAVEIFLNMHDWSFCMKHVKHYNIRSWRIEVLCFETACVISSSTQWCFWWKNSHSENTNPAPASKYQLTIFWSLLFRLQLIVSYVLLFYSTVFFTFYTMFFLHFLTTCRAVLHYFASEHTDLATVYPSMLHPSVRLLWGYSTYWGIALQAVFVM